MLYLIPVGDHNHFSYWLGTHIEVCKNSLIKNSLIKKFGTKLSFPLICSISKSKQDNKACHLAKICLETRF